MFDFISNHLTKLKLDFHISFQMCGIVRPQTSRKFDSTVGYQTPWPVEGNAQLTFCVKAFKDYKLNFHKNMSSDIISSGPPPS